MKQVASLKLCSNFVWSTVCGDSISSKWWCTKILIACQSFYVCFLKVTLWNLQQYEDYYFWTQTFDGKSPW